MIDEEVRAIIDKAYSRAMDVLTTHKDRLIQLAERLVAHAPERMLWATNWPHPGQLDPLDTGDLLRLRQAWLPTSRLERQVLVDNPAELYGFAPVPKLN